MKKETKFWKNRILVRREYKFIKPDRPNTNSLRCFTIIFTEKNCKKLSAKCYFNHVLSIYDSHIAGYSSQSMLPFPVPLTPSFLYNCCSSLHKNFILKRKQKRQELHIKDSKWLVMSLWHSNNTAKHTDAVFWKQNFYLFFFLSLSFFHSWDKVNDNLRKQ